MVLPPQLFLMGLKEFQVIQDNKVIRDNKVHQIASILQTGGKHGMRTMNQTLFELYRSRQITYEEALSRTVDQEDLKRIFQRQG